MQKQKLQNHDFQYCFTQSEKNWHYQEQLKNFNRIAIMGGGHCSLALSRVMNNLGYDVFVFETRENISTLGLNKFATKVHIISDFKEAVSRINLPHRTQIVIMTTDVASDVRVLLGILDKPFPFVGVMGSHAKISEITKQLKNEGISDKAEDLRFGNDKKLLDKLLGKLEFLFNKYLIKGNKSSFFIFILKVTTKILSIFQDKELKKKFKLYY